MRSRKGCFIMKQPFYIVKFNFKYIILIYYPVLRKPSAKYLSFSLQGYF